VIVPVRFILIFLIAGLLTIMAFIYPAQSHALQPGYLELERLEKDIYAVLWKQPAVGSRPMAIEPRLPQNCDKPVPVQKIWDGSAYLSRWTTTCEGGLEGREIRIAGLEKTSTDVLVRFEFSTGATETRRLTPDKNKFTMPQIPSRLDVIETYLLLGIEHILSGFDHLLFLLALLLLVKGVRSIVATITAFTVAHSLTLAAASLGWVKVPVPAVEAVIALSIVFVAVEVVHSRQGRQGLSSRSPWIVAFVFGLVHGFGFAGALSELGLPQTSVPMALLFFNLGVEIGQLIFVAAIILLIRFLIRITAGIDAYIPEWAKQIPVYLIGCFAAFFLFQRIGIF
jgi:hydrogenase/urease accessory protein HupE